MKRMPHITLRTLTSCDWMHEHQHRRAFRAVFGLEGAPVLEVVGWVGRRYPSILRPNEMGIAKLHPSYGTTALMPAAKSSAMTG